MLKMSVESVEPGAVLAKPIVNESGSTLIAAGVEASEPLKEKLISMGSRRFSSLAGWCLTFRRRNSLLGLT